MIIILDDLHAILSTKVSGPKKYKRNEDDEENNKTGTSRDFILRCHSLPVLLETI
jgi:hypothetical protein